MKKPLRKIVIMIVEGADVAYGEHSCRADEVGADQNDDWTGNLAVDELGANQAADDARQVENDRSHQSIPKRQARLVQQQRDPVDEQIDEHQAHEESEAEKHAADREAVPEQRNDAAVSRARFIED